MKQYVVSFIWQHHNRLVSVLTFVDLVSNEEEAKSKAYSIQDESNKKLKLVINDVIEVI